MRPEAEADLLPSAPARARLAYDELLRQSARAGGHSRAAQAACRTAACRNRQASQGDPRRAALHGSPARNSARWPRSTPIWRAPQRMLRLLQGDVGSGKTVVALLAMAIAVEAGAQAALMAPTEILARQHLQTIERFRRAGRLAHRAAHGARARARARGDRRRARRQGRIDILIGTHALFQEQIAFKDLALVVIDEQHRFGVHQRLRLQAKGSGRGAELLVMTATPIPRTLLLTSYGDMDVSRLDEKPPGRKPIATRTVPLERWTR